jgi:hypothetical protein
MTTYFVTLNFVMLKKMTMSGRHFYDYSYLMLLSN